MRLRRAHLLSRYALNKNQRHRHPERPMFLITYTEKQTTTENQRISRCRQHTHTPHGRLKWPLKQIYPRHQQPQTIPIVPNSNGMLPKTRQTHMPATIHALKLNVATERLRALKINAISLNFSHSPEWWRSGLIATMGKSAGKKFWYYSPTSIAQGFTG